jgi:hypothetical protein
MTARSDRPLPLPAAAAALGVSTPTLRRWLRRGAPVARRGGRGPGRAALVDPGAVRAWRNPRTVGVDARVLAAVLPDKLAQVLAEAHREIDGPHKRAAAGVIAGAWYCATVAILDELRLHDPAIPELDVLPDAIQRLRRIAQT